MYDVIVIGAGPAGMMASIAAASNNKKVLLIEKNEKVGKKLEITGGSRCNLTNLKDVQDFINEIPGNNKFLYSSIFRFGPHDIYDYFTNLGIELKVEEDDKVFLGSDKAIDIIKALTSEMKKNGVCLKLGQAVISIDADASPKKVITETNVYEGENIIITTGGCSYPATGSTGDGYGFARSLNHNVTKLHPAETFIMTKKQLPLTGISVESIKIKLDDKTEVGDILFTHKGLSGPAIFKISEEVYKSLKKKRIVFVKVDFVTTYTEDELQQKLNSFDSKKEVLTFVRQLLPKRLADYIIGENQLNFKVGDLSNVMKKQIIDTMKNFAIEIVETGSLEKSFVTGGGVDLDEVNPKTMESKKVSGIYFAGEVLNIHGHTGGYNITIALSTGYAAGKGASEK